MGRGDRGLGRGMAGPMSAVFSECGRYRYLLERHIAGTGRRCTFVLLNPSTADDVADDPTTRRCIDFARQWGYGRLAVVNLYAWRSTSPADMFRAADEFDQDIIGPKTDTYIDEVSRESALVVVGWGNAAANRHRAQSVLQSLSDRQAPVAFLHMTKAGHPAHPLYLPRSSYPHSLTAARP